MRDYRKYDVWKKSHEMTLHIYKTIVLVLPKSEQYELTGQMKRAAYSIPLNIVEECGRNTDKDFTHFLDIALGSCQEVEYCTLLVFDLGYIDQVKYDQLNEMINELKAKLINLIKSIRK